MKDLFLHVSQKIEAIAGAPVRMVDFDLGQLEQEPLPSLSYPAVLISFNAPDWTQLGAGAQQAEVQITLRIAFRTFERTHSKAQSSYRNEGLSHLDTLAAIHKALNGSSGDHIGALSRISMATEARADLRVYKMTYVTEYVDCPTPPFVPWDDIEGLEGVDLCLDVEVNDGQE